MTTQVTGPIFDEEGTALANVTCVVRARDGMFGQDDGLRVKRGATITTDGSGVFEADLKPGIYDLFVFVPVAGGASPTTKVMHKITVLDQATQTLQSALEGGT